jgi:hypothetical protein
MRHETSRVSFLMCPFCVRALMSTEATQPSLHLLGRLDETLSEIAAKNEGEVENEERDGDVVGDGCPAGKHERCAQGTRLSRSRGSGVQVV